MKLTKYFLLILMILIVPTVFAGPILPSSNIDLRTLKDLNLNAGQNTNWVLTVFSGESPETFTANIKINDTTITNFVEKTITGTTSTLVGPNTYMFIYPLPINTNGKTGEFTLTATVVGSTSNNNITVWTVGRIFNSVSCVDGDQDGYQSNLCGGRDTDDNNIAIVPTSCPDKDGDGQTDVMCGGTDCDDLDKTLNSTDYDNDGYSTCSVPKDCDSNNLNIYPGALEVNDNTVDENCDGILGHTAVVQTSGGGGGGGGNPTKNPATAHGCVRHYNCTEWTECNNGTQRCMNLTDDNGCAPIAVGFASTITQGCEIEVEEPEEPVENELTGYLIAYGPIKLTKNQVMYGGFGLLGLILLLILYKIIKSFKKESIPEQVFTQDSLQNISNTETPWEKVVEEYAESSRKKRR